MSRTLDIETLIEDAFIALLPSYLDTDVTAVRWEDIKNKSLTPIVKVKANLMEEKEGTINLYCATNVAVDFGVFTSKRDDETGKVANGIRADVRNLLNQDNIVTELNSASTGLLVYNNGIIPQSSTDLPDDKLWQKNLSILAVATTT